MVNKTYTLGLLAAAVMVMPTAAFAGEAVIQQEINQNATVGDNSRVNQKADQRATQERARVGYPNSGRQNARQQIDQNGAAFDNSVVDQLATQKSEQIQQNRQFRGRSFHR
ncbi:hypothetical protein BZZ01_12535 [Nostocales cyanobacterium HT-58-2]|nr:hypothetical protein BZZ01_12535 [Nostocales cyanobacterium HT-58-2]